VDAQSILPSLRSDRSSGWEIASAYHTALQHSVGTHFSREMRGEGARGVVEEGGEYRYHAAPSPFYAASRDHAEFPIIHCMCHSQGTLLSILAIYPAHDAALDVPSTLRASEERGGTWHDFDWGSVERCRRQAPVVRGSDDFWPTLASSHGPHIFANALNSLLISFLGLQDWDMFQTGLGPPSHMHAAARAISGGPVYVSDRPDEHDDEVLRRLACSGGQVPRCLRNAHPAERTLFQDPQRWAGVPLLLQNINPAGGLVVAAFHVFGSVLENDVEFFRTVAFEEVRWTGRSATAEAQQRLLACYHAWEEGEARRGADKGGAGGTVAVGAKGDSSLPWFADPSFAEYLVIDATVSPCDVEEVWEDLALLGAGETLPLFPLSAHHSVSRAEFVGFRASDQALLDLDLATGADVPVSLDSQHSFDIVTFAPRHYWTRGAGPNLQSGDEWANKWVAVIGSPSMYNAGGVVRAVQLSVSAGGGATVTLQAQVELLGSGGEYLLVGPLSLLQAEARVVSVLPTVGSGGPDARASDSLDTPPGGMASSLSVTGELLQGPVGSAGGRAAVLRLKVASAGREDKRYSEASSVVVLLEFTFKA